MATLSIICLSLVALFCVVGALSPAYRDNLLQRVGLACVGLACLALLEHVWRAQWVNPACALLAVGLLCFAVGTAAKVLHFATLDLLGADLDGEVHP